MVINDNPNPSFRSILATVLSAYIELFLKSVDVVVILVSVKTFAIQIS